MIVELGHFALIMAFGLSLGLAVSVSLSLCRAQTSPLASGALTIAPSLQLGSSIGIIIAFLALLYAFVQSDFSVALVAQHSHVDKPLLYKITGVWGNHEGSLLLWLFVLAIFGGIFCCAQSDMPIGLRATILMVHAWVTSGFAAFSLLTSNAFTRLDPAPIGGNGLNPILQDIGLAIHPPMLYLGYVGLSLAYAFAVAGLIQGRINQDWARWIRPWVSIAWSFLTAGIVLGSWWAYYELGWGGWWFWDPVENASLMPWLVTTALLHSVILVEKRQLCQSWAVLLAVLGFGLSLLGTFIVRSGLLTSVHSFATDPARGVFILCIVVLAVGIPLALYALRANSLSRAAQFSILSRESALIANNFILLCSTSVVLLGTFYPLGLELLTAAKISVGPPYYNATFLPITSLALIGMVLAAQLVWRQGWMPQSRLLLMIPLVMALSAAALAMGLGGVHAARLAGISLTVWLTSGIVVDIIDKLYRKKQLTHSRISTFVPMWTGHLGIALIVAGGLGEALGQREIVVRLKPAQSIAFSPYKIRFDKITSTEIDNYQSLQATLSIIDTNDEIISLLKPERRFYSIEQQHTTEAAIDSFWWGDYYAVLGDGNPQTGYSLRIYRKPLITWLWVGGTLMVVAGVTSVIINRRKKTVQDGLIL